MTAYYSENDPFAANWLRNLIGAGLIAPGRVDERDIRDVKPSDLDGYTQHHFFAGIGGWSYALRLAGWPDDRPVVTGSCPCQPFSIAGSRQGVDDPRHLWPAFRWLIAQRRPSTIFGEQVASRAGIEWVAGVRRDMEYMGYAIGLADVPAAGVGAPHIRQRIFWMADTECARKGVRAKTGLAVDRDEVVTRPGPQWKRSPWEPSACWHMPDARRRCEHGALAVVDGVSEHLDAIRGFGNAIVPQVAAVFIRAYMESL